MIVAGFADHKPKNKKVSAVVSSPRRHAYYPDAVPDLLPFQRRLLRTLHSNKYQTFAWSMPRGNGKSFLAALALLDFVLPESPRFQPNKTCLCLAASLEQARVIFGYLRVWLEGRESEYRFSDSVNQLSVRHKTSNTTIKAISSKAKTALGIVNVPWVVADEPGAWEVVGGELMKSALTTAQGKRGSDLRILFIGTRAPAHSGWWIDLLQDGTSEADGRFVYDLVAVDSRWDRLREVRRVNPVTASHPLGVKILKTELKKAKHDPAAKAEFFSYRLNIPMQSEAHALVKPHQWEKALKRAVAPRSDWFMLGIDLGSNRAWSAAVAIWDSGRVEALALTPGIPSIAEQEQRDRVPSGEYQKLVDDQRLVVVHGREEPDPIALVDAVASRWGEPDIVLCDRFRLTRLRDAVADSEQVARGWNIQERRLRWSESVYDIDALRQLCADGILSVERESIRLLTHSVKVASVEHDNQGNYHLIKRGYNNEARDDVAVALTLAAGMWKREYFDGEPASAVAAE